HHSPGDADHVLGLSAWFEFVGVDPAHLGDRVRDRHTDRVRVAAGVENPLSLVPAHPYLFGSLGRCGFVHGGVRRCGVGCPGHLSVERSWPRWQGMATEESPLPASASPGPEPAPTMRLSAATCTTWGV